MIRRAPLLGRIPYLANPGLKPWAILSSHFVAFAVSPLRDKLAARLPPAEIQQLKNLAAETQKIRMAPISGALHFQGDNTIDPARARRHYQNAIAHIDGLIDVMRNQKH